MNKEPVIDSIYFTTEHWKPSFRTSKMSQSQVTENSVSLLLVSWA